MFDTPVRKKRSFFRTHLTGPLVRRGGFFDRLKNTMKSDVRPLSGVHFLISGDHFLKMNTKK